MDVVIRIIEPFWPVLLAVLVGWALERILPWRAPTVRPVRWLHAGLLYLIGVILSFVVIPVGHGEAALIASERGWGAMHLLGLPLWLMLPLGVLALDFAEWLSHLLMHKSRLLWRIHTVHHSDVEMDVSTGLRFHPVEVLIRFTVGLGFVYALGIPLSAVLVYTALAIGFNIWEHANVPMPRALRPMMWLFITPELHRLHHSDDSRHFDGNLGVVFSVWDRFFGTLVEDLQCDVKFGIGLKQSKGHNTLGGLLFAPFRRN